MTTNRHLTAVYSMDEDSQTWLVHLAEDERVHSYGRTFRSARSAIAEAAALWFETESDTLDIADQLPPSYQEPLDELADARARLECDQADVNARTLDAVRMLRDWCGASERDIAKMTGLSHQRVHQLVASGG